MDELFLRSAEKALSRCHTICSGSLLEDTKRLIIQYMMHPSEPSWDRISGMMVKGHRTLWQAVILKDPSFPRTGRRYECTTYRVVKKWERIPEPRLLLEAIKNITEENNYEFTKSGTQKSTD